jgi:hypothetical protein
MIDPDESRSRGLAIDGMCIGVGDELVDEVGSRMMAPS